MCVVCVGYVCDVFVGYVSGVCMCWACMCVWWVYMWGVYVWQVCVLCVWYGYVVCLCFHLNKEGEAAAGATQTSSPESHTFY